MRGMVLASLMLCLAHAAGCDVAARRQAEAQVQAEAARRAATTRELQADPQSSLAPSLKTADQQGSDWPSFLGATGDSKSTETGILTHWPAGGPPLVWQLSLGTGYCMPTVRAGRLFQFDRHDDRARLRCLASKTGEPMWTFEYPTDFQDLYNYENGPRCSPISDDERVYIFGAEGMLHCLNIADGKPVWKVDTAAEFGVIQNFFGVGSTPILDGDLLIVQVGGSPAESKSTRRAGSTRWWATARASWRSTKKPAR